MSRGFSARPPIHVIRGRSARLHARDVVFRVGRARPSPRHVVAIVTCAPRLGFAASSDVRFFDRSLAPRIIHNWPLRKHQGRARIAPPAYTLEARADILVSTPLLDRLSFQVADAVTDSAAEAVVESVQAPSTSSTRCEPLSSRFWKHSPGFVNSPRFFYPSPPRDRRELGRGCAPEAIAREPATISKPPRGFPRSTLTRTRADLRRSGSRHPYFFSSSQVYAGEPVAWRAPRLSLRPRTPLPPPPPAPTSPSRPSPRVRAARRREGHGGRFGRVCRRPPRAAPGAG